MTLPAQSHRLNPSLCMDKVELRKTALPRRAPLAQGVHPREVARRVRAAVGSV